MVSVRKRGKVYEYWFEIATVEGTRKWITKSWYPSYACPPVYECLQEKVCERYIVQKVPYIMPIHTKIVNHHIYEHSYKKCYTMSECDTYENIYDPCCKNF